MNSEQIKDLPERQPETNGTRVTLYRWLGTFFFGIGAVGIGVPLLPTVPFWILAAFFYGKSAPALRERVYAHPRFGKPVRDFLEHGALSKRAKLAAMGGIAAGITISVLAFSLPVQVAFLLVLILLPVIYFLLTRPEPARNRPDNPRG